MVIFEFIKKHLRKVFSIRLRVQLGLALRHRAMGYAFLEGFGLEIGALHNPARLNRTCTIEYADAISKKEAMLIFPEVNPKDLVDAQYIIDLDKTGLADITSAKYDFVIMNHVIEHIANPIHVIAELFRVVKKEGYIVISAPDKTYTFDRARELTTFTHLHGEYINKVNFVSNEHYQDFVEKCIPNVDKSDSVEMATQIQRAKSRREHAHVWDSNSFEQFMRQSFEVLGISAQSVYCSLGHENRAEIFLLYRKM